MAKLDANIEVSLKNEMLNVCGGREFAAAMCKALKLPQCVVSFELRCKVNELPTIKCEYYPDISDSQIIQEMNAVMEEFDLVKRKTLEQSND